MLDYMRDNKEKIEVYEEYDKIYKEVDKNYEASSYAVLKIAAECFRSNIRLYRQEIQDS